MIAGLNPYPVYKNSGVLWLGQVPAHWEVKRNKLFLEEVNERSEDGVEELLSISQYTGVTPRRERLSAEGDLLTNAVSLVGYKRVRPGDLVMNIMLAWNGSLGVSAAEGIASPAYCVFRAKKNVEPRFLHYLFRTPLFTGAFKTVSTGVVESRLRLYPDVFFRLPSVLPALLEQSAIVRFLDYADRRIRRYIRTKKKLIALLNEQKQAIIHRAVTRGLDPSVRLKPSGVEWLGEVPEHWEVKPLKHLVPQVTVGIVIQPAQLYVKTGVPCLRSLNISGGVVRHENMVFISEASNAKHRKSQIFAGDVVVVRTGQAGVAAIVTPEFNDANCIDLLIVRRSHELISEYLLTYLNSWPARIDVQYRSVGAIQAHYNTATLANLIVAVPPIAEQQVVLNDLVARLHPIDKTAQAAAREINLLHEYRTRLIADVVTGKLDVRDAATRLPDEAEESEPLAEDEAMGEDEAEAQDADLDALSEEAVT